MEYEYDAVVIHESKILGMGDLLRSTLNPLTLEVVVNLHSFIINTTVILAEVILP